MCPQQTQQYALVVQLPTGPKTRTTTVQVIELAPPPEPTPWPTVTAMAGLSAWSRLFFGDS